MYGPKDELLPSELVDEISGWNQDMVSSFYHYFDALGLHEAEEGEYDHLVGFDEEDEIYQGLIKRGYSHDDIYKAYKLRQEELKEKAE